MLTDIAEFVRADFARSGCPALVQYGIEDLGRHSSPFRVVIVPTKDSFKEPLSVPNRGQLPQNPRAIGMRRVGFDAMLWASAPVLEDAQLQYVANYRLMDALINQFYLSMERAVQGAWSVTGGEYNMRQAVVKDGCSYALHCSVEMPVVETRFRDAVDACCSTWDLTTLKFAVRVDETEPSGDLVVASVIVNVPPNGE